MLQDYAINTGPCVNIREAIRPQSDNVETSSIPCAGAEAIQFPELNGKSEVAVAVLTYMMFIAVKRAQS